jgi:FkbM family methyltransferase
MSFVSYAQNFEDVMLWRALKHIETGFYIDVGAQDPEVDSVTKTFYDSGWHGINVEPSPQWFDKLQEKRSRDINLQLAAGSESGACLLYEFPDTGLSTIDKITAERHKTELGFKNIERTVPVETITSICQRFSVDTIHFLKIDVEGAEKKVVAGIDFSVVRPWIVVIESTLPDSQVEDYEGWDSILTAASYDYIYFDGLNRFYVDHEHSELKEHFNVPPNIFDGFVLSGVASQPFYKLIEKKAQQAEMKAQQAEAAAQHVSQALNAIYASRSWRITAPLRWMGKFARWFVRGSIAWLTFAPMSRPRLFVRKSVIPIKKFFYFHPRLKTLALRLLALFPGLKARLKMVDSQPRPESYTLTIEGPEQLSPRARQIYNDLKAAIKQRRKEQS